MLANVKGVKEPLAVITDEPPSLNTLWQYALRFRVEERFLDSKSGVFELEASSIRSATALERLYLVAAVAILYGTTQGMAVQLDGLRTQVDPHWTRGISYLKIGLRWLKGSVNKGRPVLQPIALFLADPEPCFAFKKAEALKPNIMTASGSPGFSLCAANYHPGRLAKDVSGSQHNQSVWWFHEQGVFQYM